MQIKKYLTMIWRFPFAVVIFVLLVLTHLLVSLASLNKEAIDITLIRKHEQKSTKPY